MDILIANQTNLILLVKLIFSGLITLLIINITRPFFIKKEWLDFSSERKRHNGSIPLNGGFSMSIGLLLGLLLFFNSYENYIFLALCSALIFSIGFIDDITELSPNSRMIIQFIICLIAFSYGNIIIGTFGDLFSFGVITFNRLSLLVTILAIMAGTNSLNFVDGIDGLSSGLAIISFISLSYMANLGNNVEIFQVSLLYISILIPFFFINLFGKKIFMGDAGALLIGLGIAWLLIDASQSQNMFIKPVTALWIYALPLIDLVSVIVVRISSKTSPFLPDTSSHIHNQIINQLGFSKRKTLALMLIVSTLFAIVGIIGDIVGVPEYYMFYSLSLILLIYLALILRYSDHSKLNDAI
jgi:UDP-GlcNAc:undecaprenyl-phosphate/decaprenyl-phosphate GlcNAc-1-phosphate transferase